MEMEKAKLCELVDIYLGVTHTPEYVFNGVPFLSVKDISGGKICFNDCKYISQEEYDSLSEGAKPKVGDMLFCRVGTLGKPIIIPEGTPLFGSFVSLGYLRNKNTDRCDLNYLRYWMYSNSFWKQVNSNVKGASQVNLNTGWLSKFDVDLPDMQEQKHRISVLDKCKAIIEQREEELKVLDNLIKARFVEMFGDENNSKNWDIVSVEEVTDVQVGVVIKPSQYYTDKANGVKAFRSLNIGAGYIKDVDWVCFTEEGHLKNSKSILKENDLLIVRSGTPGTACVVTKEYEGYNAIDVIIAHPYCDKVNPYYLCYFTNMPHGKKQIDEGTGGAAQQHFNVGKYNKLQLMLPPMRLQDEFAAFVYQVDKSKVAVQKALDETQLLFDSLMQQYFG